MMLSKILSAKVKDLINVNLISIDSLIQNIHKSGELHPQLYIAIDRQEIIENEEDLQLKSFLLSLKNVIALRKKYTAYIFEFKSIVSDLQNLKLYLFEAQKFNIIGKSYHETQALKAMIYQHISKSKNESIELESRIKNLVTKVKDDMVSLNITKDMLLQLPRNDSPIQDIIKVSSSDSLKESIQFVEGTIGYLNLYIKGLICVIDTVSAQVDLEFEKIVKYVIEKEAFNY